MEVLIITGMSGAGKTAVLNLCEDNNYYPIDNLPPKLLKEVIKLLQNSTRCTDKLAAVIDLRGGDFFDDLSTELAFLKDAGIDVKVLFVDADHETLIRRYKELRRPHPLGEGQTIEQAIKKERSLLESLKESSDYYINTTNYRLASLKNAVEKVLQRNQAFFINLISFGFKHGPLSEADFIFDVRFIDNPYYNPELRQLTGLDLDVKHAVLKEESVQEFIDHLQLMIKNLIPHFKQQGKSTLVIGFGCTGGKHRSVAIAEAMNKKFLDNCLNVEIYHRDSNLW